MRPIRFSTLWLCFFFFSHNVFAVGLRVGMAGAVKAQTNEVDEKVERKKVKLEGLSVTSASPFSVITVTGRNFYSDSELYLRFTGPNGYQVESAAYPSSETSMGAVVPVYVNFDTGNFEAGTVSVQIVRKQGSDITVSDPIEGFQITNIPTASGTLGSNTVAYLTNVIQMLGDAKNHLSQLSTETDGTVQSSASVALFDNMITNYTALRTEVQSLVSNQNQSFPFMRQDGVETSLNAQTLALIDRMFEDIVDPPTGFSPMSSHLSSEFLGHGAPKVSGETDSCCLEGMTVDKAVDRVNRYGGIADFFVDLVDITNKLTKNDKALDDALKIPGRFGTLHFVTFTFVPATTALYEELALVTAATGSLTWKDADPAITRWQTKVMPGLLDEIFPLMGTTINTLGDLIVGPVDTDNGILLTQRNAQTVLQNNIRAAVEDTGRLPEKTGLDLILRDGEGATDLDSVQVSYTANETVDSNNCWSGSYTLQVTGAPAGSSITVSATWVASASATADAQGKATLSITTPQHCPCLDGTITVKVNGTTVDTHSSSCF